MDGQDGQKQTDESANIQPEITIADTENNNKSKKNIIIIVSSILTSLIILFLIMYFINIGGFSGIRIRTTWNQIESFLNKYTNDDFKIISQDGNTLKISFDENGLSDFSCWKPSIFNMGFTGLQCSLKYYYDSHTTDRLGGYYHLKNIQEVDKLITNTPGITTSVFRDSDGYRRISFDSEIQLKQFFDKLIEIEDFKNTWEIYKELIAINGEIRKTQSVEIYHPASIIDPNTIYLDIYVRSDYESLYEYAYKHNW